MARANCFRRYPRCTGAKNPYPSGDEIIYPKAEEKKIEPKGRIRTFIQIRFDAWPDTVCLRIHFKLGTFDG